MKKFGRGDELLKVIVERLEKQLVPMLVDHADDQCSIDGLGFQEQKSGTPREIVTIIIIGPKGTGQAIKPIAENDFKNIVVTLSEKENLKEQDSVEA